MATFKCKMCDAVLNVREGTSIYVCEYCGTKQTVPMNGDFGSGHNEKHESVSVGSLLKRAFMFLEDGKWKQANQYCERVLDIDPENVRAYLGKLMADINVHRESELSNPCMDYRNNDNYIKVLRFGDPQMVKNLKSCSIESAYKMALKLMTSAVQEKDYYQAANQFRSVAGYKCADERAVECEELAKQKAAEAKNKQLNEQLNEQFRKNAEKKYNAISYFLFCNPVLSLLFVIVLSFNALYVVNCFFISILSVVYVLCIAYGSYLHNFIDHEKQNQYLIFKIVIINSWMFSLAIAIVIHDMKVMENAVVLVYIILGLCSLLSGLIGYLLGKIKAEEKSKK